MEPLLRNLQYLRINLVPRSHSVTGNVRSGKVRQYTIFHWPPKKGCGNAIYAPIGLFRGHVMKVFTSSCVVSYAAVLCLVTQRFERCVTRQRKAA